MDPIVYCPFFVLLFQYPYCPLDTLFSLLNIHFVRPLYCSGLGLSFVLLCSITRYCSLSRQ